MTTDSADVEHTEAARAPRVWRNIALLASCQALFMTGTSMVITVSALVGARLAPDAAWATVPLGLQFAATTLATLPAAFIMKRIGRRAGFELGVLTGMAGAALGAWAIFVGDFFWFCGGAALVGLFNAFGQYYRFAAADAAPQALRSRAISWVPAGGVVAAVAGPNLARLSRDLFAPALFAGSFVGLVCLQIAAAVLRAFIDLPRAAEDVRHERGRPLAAIVRQDAFIVAVLGGIIGFASMSFIMTATPLAMHAHGHVFDDTAFVIEWHILGMFAPSFFTGHLIRRVWVFNVMLAGGALTLGCALVNLAGTTLAEFWIALVLLGVGWNFLYIGASTLLTETYRPAEAAKTQGLNEFLVFGSVALASLSAGALQSRVGWQAVNYGVIPFVVVVLAAVLWVRPRLMQQCAQAAGCDNLPYTRPGGSRLDSIRA